MRYLLFSLISLFVLASEAQAWEYMFDDFSTSNWGSSNGWGSCSAYSQSRPCISNGNYFGVDSGDVVFSYTFANIYDVIDVSDMSYSYDSSKTYYMSFDAMVGPRNDEQGNKTEALGVTIYYKKSDGSIIGYETFSQSINNTSMETFEFALNDAMLSNSSLDNLQIIISGRDNGYWNGNYGMVLANGSVQLTDYDPSAPPAPTYSSSISSAQQTSVNNSRSVTHSGNGIYISQVGDHNTLNITQQGTDNLIAGFPSSTQSVSTADITGDNNTTTMNQTGNNNVILFEITGDYNDTTVDQGGASGADDNRAEFLIGGDYNTIDITQHHNDGMGNNGHYLGLALSGNNNNVLTSQTDDGDKIGFIAITGDDNDIDLYQKGTGSHYVEIEVGSDQTVDVFQDGTGNHNASISMTGYSATLDLTQDSSTNQTYSISQNCVNSSGCGVTTVTQQ